MQMVNDQMKANKTAFGFNKDPCDANSTALWFHCISMLRPVESKHHGSLCMIHTVNMGHFPTFPL